MVEIPRTKTTFFSRYFARYLIRNEVFVRYHTPAQMACHLCECMNAGQCASEAFVDQIVHQNGNVCILYGNRSVTVLVLLRAEGQMQGRRHCLRHGVADSGLNTWVGQEIFYHARAQCGCLAVQFTGQTGGKRYVHLIDDLLTVRLTTVLEMCAQVHQI